MLETGIVRSVMLRNSLVCDVQSSGLPLEEPGQHRGFELSKREDTRPDVFLLNQGTAYSGWYQVWLGCTCRSAPLLVRSARHRGFVLLRAPDKG